MPVTAISQYAQIRNAVRLDQSLPLTWDQVIDLSPIKSPEIRQNITQSLERIQASQTGQEILHDILLRPDKDEPLKITDVENGITNAALYDSYPHMIEIQPQMYKPHFAEISGITPDQYLVHELAHAATSLHHTFRNAHSVTMQDDIFVRAKEEKKAEDFVQKYNQENHLKSRSYTEPDSYKSTIKLIKSGFLTEQNLAEEVTHDTIIQSTIDGLNKEQSLQALQDRVISIQSEHGIDISTNVQDFLNSPAPEYDDRDYVIDTSPQQQGPGKNAAPGL